jgi:hypothetical protein
MANTAAPVTSRMALADERLRSLSKPSGNKGCRERSSMETNRARRIPAATSEQMVPISLQLVVAA